MLSFSDCVLVTLNVNDDVDDLVSIFSTIIIIFYHYYLNLYHTIKKIFFLKIQNIQNDDKKNIGKIKFFNKKTFVTVKKAKTVNAL